MIKSEIKQPGLGSKFDNTARILVILLLCAAYLLVGIYALSQHPYVGETDTSMFIEYASAINQQGGAWNFVKSLYLGKFTPSNQNPLFPFIISLFQQPKIEYFVQIKLLNLFLGLMFLLLFYSLIRKEAGEIYAAISSCLIIANDIFIHQTTMVSCETLLIIFSSLSFYYLIRGLDDNRLWIPAGIFTGLTYMTKASGLFIVFGFGIFLLADKRFHFWELLKNKYLWLYILMFLLISSPLLVRNTIVYKFPFYNYNLQVVAMDEDWGRHDRLAQFSDIFKKDIKDNIIRFFWGLGREFRILLHSLYPFSIHYVPKFMPDISSLTAKISGAVAAFLIFCLSAYGFVKSAISKRKKSLIAFLVIGFYLPLSWYSINAPNRRYLMPVMLFFLAFASVPIYVLFKRFCAPVMVKFLKLKDYTGKRLLRYSVITLLAGFSFIYPFIRTLPDPLTAYKFEDGYHELAAYLQKNLGPGEKYLKKGEHNYAWIMLYPELEKKREGRKYFRDMQSFADFIKARKDIKFFLMDAEVFRMTKHFLNEYIRWTDSDGFEMVRDLPGWEIAMKDEHGKKDYILFKRK